jgi:hypothetical protein
MSRRYFTPPSSPRSRSPERDRALVVETVPQDPDIFNESDSDYYSTYEGLRDPVANMSSCQLPTVEGGRYAMRLRVGETKSQ